MLKRRTGAAILLALSVLVSPGQAADLPDYEQDLIRYDEAVTQKDAEIRRQFLSEIEGEFFQDYQALWQRMDMSRKLSRAIARAMEEKVDPLWLAPLQIVTDWDNIVQTVQDAVGEHFRKDYEAFLKEQEEYFAESYLKKMRAYDDALRASRAGILSDIPSVRRFFERRTAQVSFEKALAESASGVRSTVALPEFSKGGTVALAGTVLARRLLQRTLARKAVTAVGRGVGNKMLAAVSGAGALITLGWALYDVGNFTMEVWDSPKELEAALTKNYTEHFTEICPHTYWDILRTGVKDELEEIRLLAQRRDDDTKAIMASPAFRRLTAMQTPAEQELFIDKLLLSRPENGQVSYNSIADYFGAVLLQTDMEDLPVLRKMLSGGDLLLIRSWLQTAGTAYYGVYRELPPAVWKIYPPDRDSLDLLTWMAALPQKARTAAAALRPDEVRWIRGEMPPGQAPRLLDAQDPAKIRSEIARLEKLPKASREAWQSDMRYFLNRLRRYLPWLLALAAALGTGGLLARRGIRRRKGDVQCF